MSTAAKNEINEYLQGKRKEFSPVIIKDIKANMVGTDFQKSVWLALLDIPYGQTRTYQQIAAAIGKPKATRAVGTACGKNTYDPIIPCHRVVATGGLGGFAHGLNAKKKLLKLEGII